jgi:hypothetical protein
MRFSTCSLGLLVLLNTGCASLLGQSSWPVYVDSVNSDCDFVVRNQYGLEVNTATTPKLLRLASGIGFFEKADYTLTFIRSDLSEFEIKLPAKINPWYYANIPMVNLIGLGLVDPATGAMWSLPNRVRVDCSKANGGVVEIGVRE